MELTPGNTSASVAYPTGISDRPVETSLIQGRDIVVIGLQPWYYEIGSNCKNIATWLSKHNRVLYVNLPVNRKTYHSRQQNDGIRRHCDIIRHHGEQIYPIKTDMWEFYPVSLVESINWLPSTRLFKAVNYLNNRRFAKELKKATQRLGFKDIILFNDNDIFNGYYLKELLSPSIYIYYMRDFLQGYAYWNRHCTVLEPALISKADIVATNSTYYAEYCSGFNANSHYIGQGCNLEIFNNDHPHPLPEGMDKIPRPVIGYVGAIESTRLDEKIIAGIARAHPEWSVVMVGPEDEAFKTSSLHQLPNIHFLGRKPMAQLPDYINTFTVCINPQLINTITHGNYPLKIDEYLAMGKPVVATRTNTMGLFEKYTYLAEKPEDYIHLIETALKEDDRDRQNRRIAFAQSHSWENSVSALYSTIINQTAKKES